jgi:methylated-DNA-protein-cysteine methyltransferase-like protein
MNLFTENAIKVIKCIPSGKVLTYGQVALLAGSPRAARQVGWILRSMSDKYNLPWQRVINAQGKISMRDPIAYMEQKMRLEDEGIVFLSEDTVDLKKHFWSVTMIEFDQIILEP